MRSPATLRPNLPQGGAKRLSRRSSAKTGVCRSRMTGRRNERSARQFACAGSWMEDRGARMSRSLTLPLPLITDLPLAIPSRLRNISKFASAHPAFCSLSLPGIAQRRRGTSSPSAGSSANPASSSDTDTARRMSAETKMNRHRPNLEIQGLTPDMTPDIYATGWL